MKKLTMVLTAMLLLAVLGLAACKSPVEPTETALEGQAFSVENLIPFDQPSSGADAIMGERIVYKDFTVTLGDDASQQLYSLTVVNFTSSLNGKLYYRITSNAETVGVPTGLNGWYELAEGVLTGAAEKSESAVYRICIILISSDFDDVGKKALFDVELKFN